jgi:hypothetical protein
MKPPHQLVAQANRGKDASGEIPRFIAETPASGTERGGGFRENASTDSGQLIVLRYADGLLWQDLGQRHLLHLLEHDSPGAKLGFCRGRVNRWPYGLFQCRLGELDGEPFRNADTGKLLRRMRDRPSDDVRSQSGSIEDVPESRALAATPRDRLYVRAVLRWAGRVQDAVLMRSFPSR